MASFSQSRGHRRDGLARGAHLLRCHVNKTMGVKRRDLSYRGTEIMSQRDCKSLGAELMLLDRVQENLVGEFSRCTVISFLGHNALQRSTFGASRMLSVRNHLK